MVRLFILEGFLVVVCSRGDWQWVAEVKQKKIIRNKDVKELR